VVEQYRYDDYGQPTILNDAGTVIPASQIGNATLFTGRRYDPETGFYYYRTRYLDPMSGATPRGTALASGARQSGNGYAYVGNNPASDVDPNGKIPIRKRVVILMMGRETMGIMAIDKDGCYS